MTDRSMLFSAPMVRALLDGRKTQTRCPLYVARKVKETGELPPSRYFPDYPPPNLGLNQIATLGTWHKSKPGDRIWAKETLSIVGDGIRYAAVDADDYCYLADEHSPMHAARDLWVKKANAEKAVGWPSIFMPRWASRITLTVTDVRIERLNECSEADAIAEGVCRQFPTAEDHAWLVDYHEEHYGRPPSQADIDQFDEGVWIVPGTDCGFGPKPRQPLWGPTAANCYASLWNSINGAGSWNANPFVVAISFKVERRNIDDGAN